MKIWAHSMNLILSFQAGNLHILDRNAKYHVLHKACLAFKFEHYWKDIFCLDVFKERD